MTKADSAEQQILLKLQEQDRFVAKLVFERKQLPVLGKIEDLKEQRRELERKLVILRTAVSDAKRDLTFAEGEVQVVRTRRERQQKALDAGTMAPKDLVAVQDELQHLATRQATLEDLEIQAMENLEEKAAAVDEMLVRIDTIADELVEAENEADELGGTLDQRIDKARADRDTIAEKVGPELLEVYESIRARTGALGVVLLRGTTTTPVQLDFSLHELNEIRSTPVDEVYVSDEHECIVVRHS